MNPTYWHTQSPTKPLYPDIEWSRPEQRAQAGRLAIVGGSAQGFAAMAESYGAALEAGAGQVRALLPDGLRAAIPTSMTDVRFAPTTPSGSLSRDALGDLTALGEWANAVLMAGDASRNSETAIMYETFIHESSHPLVITRDAIDLVRSGLPEIVQRPNTMLVMSFAQLQKLFQMVYYPKVLTFSMQLLQLVDTLHKFTITYPLTIMVLHQDTMLVAHQGQVTTTPWHEPMLIWRGITAARAASYWMWNPAQPLEAATASLVSGKG